VKTETSEDIEEMQQRCDELPDGVVEVVSLFLQLFSTWESYEENISINSLTEGFKLAIQEGHDSAEIKLAMASAAMSEASPSSEELAESFARLQEKVCSSQRADIFH